MIEQYKNEAEKMMVNHGHDPEKQAQIKTIASSQILKRFEKALVKEANSELIKSYELGLKIIEKEKYRETHLAYQIERTKKAGLVAELC